jgi:hypothetical protein
MNELEEKDPYIHFLSYDQYCFDYIEYGVTDLLYTIDNAAILIKKVDHRNNREKVLEFPMESPEKGIHDELRDFLIQMLANKYNFVGTPFYVKRNVFSEAAFEEMKERAVILMKENYEAAVRANSDNELIQYCKAVGLNPEPDTSRPALWEANCISGGQHRLMLSTDSNEWGCGYCRKKGDIHALREWYESEKKMD